MTQTSKINLMSECNKPPFSQSVLLVKPGNDLQIVDAWQIDRRIIPRLKVVQQLLGGIGIAFSRELQDFPFALGA